MLTLFVVLLFLTEGPAQLTSSLTPPNTDGHLYCRPPVSRFFFLSVGLYITGLVFIDCFCRWGKLSSQSLALLALTVAYTSTSAGDSSSHGATIHPALGLSFLFLSMFL